MTDESQERILLAIAQMEVAVEVIDKSFNRLVRELQVTKEQYAADIQRAKEQLAHEVLTVREELAAEAVVAAEEVVHVAERAAEKLAGQQEEKSGGS